MKVDSDGSVTFTRNEAFILVAGIQGGSQRDASAFEIAALPLIVYLPEKLGETNFREHVSAAALDLMAGGDPGVFNV